MGNEIKIISSSKILNIDKRNTFVAEINGEEVKTEKDWLYIMAEKFRFPVFLEKEKKTVEWFEGAYGDSRNYFLNWERYEDWLTDLSWIEQNSIILIIRNYSELLIDYPESKDYIINNFKNVIFPWWEKDVMAHMVGGRTKDFNIYIISHRCAYVI